MAWRSFFPALTADTTKVTADNTRRTALDAMAGRLASLLPAGWFSGIAGTVREALFVGIAKPLTWLSAFTGYAAAQSRLRSLTGLWLDLAAFDFFGVRFRRRPGEADESFRPRLLREIIRPRATREAIKGVVTDLTSVAPTIVEPWNPGDCGAYGAGNFAYGGLIAIPAPLSAYGEPLGGYGAGCLSYGTPEEGGQNGGGAGCYGSLSLPNQMFITVHRPAPAFGDLGSCGGYGVGPFAYGGGVDGVPALGGYASPISGYGLGSGSYGIPAPPYEYFTGAGFYQTATEQVSIPDSEIFAAIAETTAAGVIPWTRIRGL